MDERLTHAYNRANLGRSLRDCAWYGGQVAVLSLSYHDHSRVLYLMLAAFAAFVSIATGFESIKWRRELARDRVSGRDKRAAALERDLHGAPSE